MNLLTIHGGPRQKGNTATILGWIEEILVGQGHSVERINTAKMKIGGCKGCWACGKVLDDPGCVRKDDALAILDKMMAADAVLIATPLYMWGFPGQIKPLLDRFVCLVKDTGPTFVSLVAGKRCGLLVTCMGAETGNADVIQTIYGRIADYARMDSAGAWVVPHCSEPDALGEPARETARTIAAKLVSDAL